MFSRLKPSIGFFAPLQCFAYGVHFISPAAHVTAAPLPTLSRVPRSFHFAVRSFVPLTGKAVLRTLSPFVRAWCLQGLRKSCYAVPLQATSLTSFAPPSTSLSARSFVGRSYFVRVRLRLSVRRCLCLGSPAGRTLAAGVSCFLHSRFAQAKNHATPLPLRGC